MSWLRLDDNYASDGKVRRARAVMWWPIILCAMKRGGGVASDDDISPDVLADIGQGDEASAARAVEGLKSSGLLIQDGSGWTTPNWREFQPDPTGSTRQRALRERNKAAHDSVTVRNSDSPLRNGVSRSVTPDSTGRDIQDKTEGVVVAANTPREADPAPHHIGGSNRAELEIQSVETAELIEFWVRTQNGSGSRAPGMFASHAAQTAIVELVATFKAERVKWAIGRAVDVANNGAPSLGLLRKLCAEGSLPERADRQGQRDAPRQNSAGRPWVQAVHEPMKRSALFDELLGGKTDGTDG